MEKLIESSWFLIWTHNSRLEISSGYEAPSNPVEERLVAIWQELLAVEQVGIHDNFFDLGGHSLLAAKAMSLLEEQTGNRIPLASLIKKPNDFRIGLHIWIKILPFGIH